MHQCKVTQRSKFCVRRNYLNAIDIHAHAQTKEPCPGKINGCLTEATTFSLHPKSQQSSSEDIPLLKNELSAPEA